MKALELNFRKVLNMEKLNKIKFLNIIFPKYIKKL